VTIKTTYIVIKCGNSAKINAAKELDKVIKKHGFSWFAKFGTPLKFQSLNPEDPNSNLILCVALMFERQYQLFSYKIEEFSKSPELKKGTYPSYYTELMPDVGTWIKVSKFEGPQPTTNDLVVKSSLIKLYQTISKAKAGFFYCKHYRD
jgi:hypothetical protein